MGKPNLNQNMQKARIAALKEKSNFNPRGHLYANKKKSQDAAEPEVKLEDAPEIVEDVKAEEVVVEKAAPVKQETTQEIYDSISDLSTKYRESNSYSDKKAVEEYLDGHDMEFYEQAYVPLSEVKQKVARMVFNGGIEKPLNWERNKFSSNYRQIANFPYKFPPCNPDDYDLSHSSVWQVFKQAPEFAALEGTFKEALAKRGVTKEMLPELNIYDFSDILYEKCKDPKNMTFAKMFEGAKQKNTKRFIEENREEFELKLLAIPNIDRNYVKDLIYNMETFGNTDMSRFKDPKTGRPYENQPVIDVHHIINIKDAGQFEAMGESFLNVNNYENMCYMERTAHEACHLTDRPLFVSKRDPVTGKREIKTIQRARPKLGIKCFLGFSKNLIIEAKGKVIDNIRKLSNAQEGKKEFNHKPAMEMA